MTTPTPADEPVLLDGVDPIALLDIARTVAAEAGALAASMRANGISVAKTKSSQLDIVTQADTAVETLIRERLQEARPGDGIFGEEEGESVGSSAVTWIVDPIDGTVNYLYGSSYYAVSIAATARAEGARRVTVAGCVYAPAMHTEYAAAHGRPALLNGDPIHVNADIPLDRALVSTGIPYDIAKRDRVLRDVTTLTPRVRDFRLVGAAALEICGVAEGRTDGHFQRGLPVWDYAAAALIARQAGATVLGIDDREPSTELLVIADRALAHTLDKIIR